MLWGVPEDGIIVIVTRTMVHVDQMRPKVPLNRILVRGDGLKFEPWRRRIILRIIRTIMASSRRRQQLQQRHDGSDTTQFLQVLQGPSSLHTLVVAVSSHRRNGVRMMLQQFRMGPIMQGRDPRRDHVVRSRSSNRSITPTNPHQSIAQGKWSATSGSRSNGSRSSSSSYRGIRCEDRIHGGWI